MNITKENTGELTAKIKIQLEAVDYQEKVDKSLKDYQRKANIPGFRSGKVPFGMIKKMVGNSVMAEEINKILVDSLHHYLEDNKIETLGNPLPVHDENNNIDWENQKNFEFSYELGLAPDLNMNLTNIKDIIEYSIKIDDEDLEKNIADIQKRYGKYETPEVTDESCMIYSEFSELDAEGNIIDGGIKHSSFIYLDQIKDKKLQKKLMDLKKDETIKVNLLKLFEEVKEIAYKLNISIEKAESIIHEFQIKIIGVNKIIPAEINDDLFEKLYGKDVISNEQDFREKIKLDMAKNYDIQVDKKFFNDVVTNLIEKTEVKLPDEFLKRWLYEINEGKFSKEQIESEYDVYAKSLKWQLIENKLITENKINVTEQDAIDFIINNFIKPYKIKKDEELENENALNEIASNVLKDKKESEKIYERIYHERLIEVFKNNINTNKKEVNINEFIKLASEKEN
jgi:trigger factor